jgi:hypothetical protein
MVDLTVANSVSFERGRGGQGEPVDSAFDASDASTQSGPSFASAWPAVNP